MSETQTRLETIILEIFNPKNGNFEKVRCFLDRGSNRTFATTACAIKCGFHLKNTDPMYISTFGNPSKKLNMQVAQVDFFRDTKTFSGRLSVNVFVLEKLVLPLNSFKLSERQLNFINFNEILLADPEAAHDGQLSVDLLLGQDCVHSITNGDPIFLPGGSILIPTWDGRHILAGPVDKDFPSTKKQVPFQNPNFIAVNAVFDHSSQNEEVRLSKKLRRQMHQVFSCVSSEEELEIIETFRNLELLGISPLEYEISPILDEFNKTTTYDGERYTVRLPFKNPQIKKLSNNFLQAFKRLMSGYKRRLKPKFADEKSKYEQSFKDELERGIIERVETLGTVDEINQILAKNPQHFNEMFLSTGKPCCYLPHHAVYKSSSGKFRRVQDGRAKPYKGAYSLNDCLEKGPNLTSNILHILIGFRKHQWACKADIEKAFPQVRIHPDDRDALRLLWFEGDKICVYRFARLPFGLTSSPMILAATLQKHLGDNNFDEEMKQNFIASLYVDDSVWSEQHLEDLYKRKELYTETFKNAGMNFRDWTSNNAQARDYFGRLENRVPPSEEKVLGMKWDLDTDTIKINSEKLKTLMNTKIKTKRHIWKLCPSIYDPMGLLSPYVLKGKLIVSEACDKVKGWDSPIAQTYIDKAVSWASEFDRVEEIAFDRNISINNPKKVQLVGCCDASSKAYGACVYLVSTAQDGTVTSNLIMAKTRNAPKIPHTIPRLELLGAVLLLNVMDHVRVIYKEISEENIFYFTDSADVIFWLYSGHHSWKPFVANQLKKIKKKSLVQNWRHIDGKENPADLASRGCTLQELLGNPMWKNGPEFWKRGFDCGSSNLTGYDKHYQNLEMSKECVSELKPEFKRQIGESLITVSSITDLQVTNNDPKVKEINKSNFNSPQLMPRIDEVMSDFENHSRNSYDFLMGVTERVLEAKNKFLNLIRSKSVKEDKVNEKLHLISSKEEVLWIYATQQKYFPELFKLVSNPKATVSSSSRSLFIKHAVFLDPELNILRCTTRNERSSLDYSSIYPILLPSMVDNGAGYLEKCHFTYLLVKKIHHHTGHQGVPHTLANLRSEFWVLKGRRFVQRVLHNCVVCRKVQGPFYSIPPSPSLPEFRVCRSRPFRGTGVDFIGPFWCREYKGKKYKAWYLIFSCGNTRAIHIEAVKSRGIDDFINAVSRFMNEKGIPDSFISDHEGSSKRLSEEFEQISKSKRVRKFFKNQRISWNFYTEKSPNKGGFIERLVALVKKTFYKTLTKKFLTFEEFRTLATYAASAINDRPLTYLYSDINSEYKALSPSMLLCGYNKREPPHLNLHKPKDEVEVKLSESYFFMEKVRNSFWYIWQKQYLKDLFERHVRQKKASGKLVVPKIGDVVLLSEEKLPRREWRMAKVVDVEEKRGAIRQCVIQLLSPGGGVLTKLKRSPDKLVPLEINSREEKFNADALIPFEGDPREPIRCSKHPPGPTQYSPKQLSRLKDAKVWPPYIVSKQFLDPSSINTGPLKDFVNEDLKPNLNPRVKFDLSERDEFIHLPTDRNEKDFLKPILKSS